MLCAIADATADVHMYESTCVTTSKLIDVLDTDVTTTTTTTTTTSTSV